MKVQTHQLDELMRNYEAALGAAGYDYSTRLRMLSRAGRLVNRHEEAGCFVLNEDVITGYFRDNDQSLYEGKISPKRWREYERDTNLSLSRMVIYTNHTSAHIQYFKYKCRFGFSNCKYICGWDF